MRRSAFRFGGYLGIDAMMEKGLKCVYYAAMVLRHQLKTATASTFTPVVACHG
jgi:hypothetical protein